MTVVSSYKSWQQRGWDAAKLGAVLAPFGSVGTTCHDLYRRLRDHHDRVRLTLHGVDLEPFEGPPPSVDPDRPLVVGWAGSLRHADLKGVHDVIEPAVAKLPGVELRLAVGDGSHPCGRALTPEEMPEYYRSVDVYVCASASEGAHLGFLEAGAAARPVVTTSVGIAPELIRHGVNGWIIDRDPGALAEALRELRDRRETVAAARGRWLREFRRGPRASGGRRR